MLSGTAKVQAPFALVRGTISRENEGECQHLKKDLDIDI